MGKALTCLAAGWGLNPTKDFSNHIRFNNNIEQSNNRVQELNQTLVAFKEFIKEHSNNSVKFKIKSFISIELEE